MFFFNPFSSIGNLPYATLEDGKVPASQLPGYVDDVLEVADIHELPVVGETGKIYVTLDNGKCWRWSGSAFIEISPTTAHKSTHATGGTDALAPSDIGAVGSDITGLTNATQLTNVVQITQAGYNAIATPAVNTLYIIVG